MKTSIYLSAYVNCESRKAGSIRLRPKGLVGIAVNNDSWAREWQRLDRIAYKCLDKVRARLTATAALADAAANHVADSQDPHTLLDLVKSLNEYRVAK